MSIEHGSRYTTSHKFKENKLLEKCPYQEQTATNKFLAKTKSIRNKDTMGVRRGGQNGQLPSPGNWD